MSRSLAADAPEEAREEKEEGRQGREQARGLGEPGCLCIAGDDEQPDRDEDDGVRGLRPTERAYSGRAARCVVKPEWENVCGECGEFSGISTETCIGKRRGVLLFTPT